MHKIDCSAEESYRAAKGGIFACNELELQACPYTVSLKSSTSRSQSLLTPIGSDHRPVHFDGLRLLNILHGSFRRVGRQGLRLHTYAKWVTDRPRWVRWRYFRFRVDS